MNEGLSIWLKHAEQAHQEAWEMVIQMARQTKMSNKDTEIVKLSNLLAEACRFIKNMDEGKLWGAARWTRKKT